MGAVVELALSNALISFALAGLAYAVHHHGRYPAMAHLLWVAVLLKALTPPVLMLPTPLPATIATSTVMGSSAAAATTPLAPGLVDTVVATFAQLGAPILVAVWLIGSAIVLAVSVRRVWLFGGLLRQTSTKAPLGLGYFARTVAEELGMRSVPPIIVTGARISPMTWWSRGRVQLVLPAALLQQVEAAELRWVLAHEFAHLKRRDHLVRWIEWAACVAFWWNPVVWWARRVLRRDEEDACDALVVERVAGAPRAYAGTLLSVVEILARPTDQVPTMATGMDAARSLEHRLSTIVSTRERATAPGPLVAGLSATVVGLMALGVGGAADGGAPAAATSAEADPGDAIPWVVGEPVERYATVGATTPVSISLAADVYVGTAGADEYVGTRADESISGLAGPDRLAGRRGRDTIDGGSGSDTLSGGGGQDTIRGGAGADTISGGGGRDRIYAGGGDDLVRTWADGTPDQVDCGAGDDRAIVDRSDTTKRCEDVVVREPA